VILYELLTGELPFRGNMRMLLHQVLHDEPRPPRRLNDAIPRDLETVALKCLQKEPGKRYASAQQLAADLGRFLHGEAIHARPVGAMERAVKWARRRPALAALVGVALLALISLTVLSAVVLDRERKAREEADKARKARDFLVSTLRLTDRKGEFGTLTARQILDDADRRVVVEFADQPELKADLEAAIEEVYTSLGTSGPQAMILEVRGTVSLEPVRDPKRRASPNTLLYQGDRLRLGEDGDVRLVFLRAFHKERLRPSSDVTIRRRGCQPDEAVRERDDDILLPFVRLPKGTFYMGWRSDFGVVEKITKGVKTVIKQDFEIALHDVTQWQWQAVMGGNPSWFSRFSGGQIEVKEILDDELKLFPVENVSWDDAQEFVKKLNEKEKGKGYQYRLPSGAEWEYACRNGATSEDGCSYRFYFDTPTNKELSLDLAKFSPAARFGVTSSGPSRVGAYPPNKLGLCDMHGNVEQWVADSDVFFSEVAVGRGVKVRGGSWKAPEDSCQAGGNGSKWTDPRTRGSDRGFRLARDPVRPK
jgi:formylglycine-generating enzyme required for sulfatase activity